MVFSLRTGTRFRYGIQHFPIKRSRNLATPRVLHGTASSINPYCRGATFHSSALKMKYLRPKAISPKLQLQVHAFFHSTSPTTPTADNLIEELQELYIIAKDLFEIATNSNGKESIYAMSDRESLQDALNQLVDVYELYTTGEKGAEMSGGDGTTKEGLPAPIIQTKFDAGSVSDTVRGDVRERFGRKVLELRNAVEAFDQKAR
ncbi:hypothetical protein PITC_017510 [Penicillium italicum]|uniref:Uncharacterized protein n=1 Tax=Penicillium italicum TaxID=40296 RepID=A0A0A2KMT7_PENIT|nr:hypothetical protein PITC_017510 [Penicillium italicum]